MFKELNTLQLFFEEPSKEFNVREIARLMKISPATASNKLNKLSKKEILIKKEYRRYIFYKANIESNYYRDIKLFYNIRRLRETGLIDELNLFYLKPTIVLFGSYAFGMDTETSDIDLLIISERKEDFHKIEFFEKKINRKIQIFQIRDIKDIKNEHLLNSIINGITIQGMLKWI